MTRDPGTLAASDLSLPRPPGYTPRRDGGLGAYEAVLGRAGFAPVAGIDEAGRERARGRWWWRPWSWIRPGSSA